MIKRWLSCLLAAAALMTACATTDKQPAAVQAPAPPPPASPPPQTLPLQHASQPVLPAEVAPQPDTTDALVKQVDAMYLAGMDNFRDGDLEQAKQQFDHALSTLLESGLDIRGDERLSAEFDKIVDNVYSVESLSLERGDALSLHNYEPTPLESFSGLTFPVDPRTKERVQEELKSVHSDLPLVSNDAVDGVIAFLQNHGREYMETVLRRQGTYGQIISDALRQAGVPQDLIYLAAGESAFNPYAVSNKACVGIWQFSAATAALFGLRRDRWVDERKDPVKSSLAAARFLKDLYQTFGDWFLAMAAYDTGPLNVQHAIERTGYADYWELRRQHALMTETENYVPIFLATALIAKDPKAYGFDTPPDPPLAVDSVKVNTPTDLRLIAELVDHPVEDLVKLNPSLQRWTTPANNPDFTLYLPAGTRDLFEQTIASIPSDKRIWWRAHKVVDGETLAGIARQYRVSLVSLAQANQLATSATLEQGAHLILPMGSGNEASLDRYRQPVRHRMILYRVRPGDTVDLLADRYNVTPYQLRRWNGLTSSRLTTGRTLHIYVEAPAAAAPARTTARRRTPPRAQHSTPRTAAVSKSKPAPKPSNRISPAAALTVH